MDLATKFGALRSLVGPKGPLPGIYQSSGRNPYNLPQERSFEGTFQYDRLNRFGKNFNSYMRRKGYRPIATRKRFRDGRSVIRVMVKKRKDPKSMMYAMYKPITYIFAPRLKCRMTYVEKVHLSGAATSTVNYSGNGIFSIKGANERPMYWDSVSAIYQEHRVDASSINIQMINSAAEGCVVSIVPQVQTTAFATLEMNLEQSKSKHVVMGSDNAADIGTLYHFETTARQYPINPRSDDLTGHWNALPTDQWYWRLYAESNADNLDLYCIVRIVYFVTFGVLFNQAVS